MIGALLSALFFGITPVVAGRAIELIGFVRTNVIRLSFAVVVMGVWAFAFGRGVQGQTMLFVTAGAVGFGIGGLSLLAALPRLGAPLASLIEETAAAPVTVVVAWLWYSEGLKTPQLAGCAVILAGVVVGLWPFVGVAALKNLSRKSLALGVGLALLAATAQGISFAATRYGIKTLTLAHAAPDVVTVSVLRLMGGLLVGLVVYLVARWVWRKRWGFAAADGSTRSVFGSDGGRLTSRPLLWGSLNSLFGPILGVTCTVWAQLSLPAGKVQSIAALAPMISVPFAFWLQGHKPPRLWYIGAAVAIVGLVLVDLNS
jgi:drug/metabolite transporter (DMT)-like permease